MMLRVFAAVLGMAGLVYAQGTDTDRDELSDELEQRLLNQFSPVFLINANDCAGKPAEFLPGSGIPRVQALNGTVYGQVSPVPVARGEAAEVEIRFYHLWNQDCGAKGHPLDSEHVSVLARASGTDAGKASWKAVYWFAAAHQRTVCDLSQIAPAAAVEGEDRGARVWVSAGKHASFFNPEVCGRGCAGDECSGAVEMQTRAVINLGESGRPMNGAEWIAARGWALGVAMSETDFPASVMARAQALGAGDIALVNAGRHPAQGVIAISSSTAGALGNSGGAAGDAIGTGYRDAAGGAAKGADSTSGALEKSARKTGSALGKSVGATKRFLRIRR